jgi:hypothetical protein
MSHHKRSLEAIKRRSELQDQKKSSRQFIRDYEFKDQVNKEEVNLVTPAEIKDHLKTVFSNYYLGAVPVDLDRGHVLDVPNVYHLELFEGCNEAEDAF